jgi:hypothetical protein
MVRFAVREDWTYVLTEVDWKGPEWTSRMDFKPPRPPDKP